MFPSGKKGNAERICSEKCKSFPPFLHSSEGIPNTSFSDIPPEMFSVECQFYSENKLQQKGGRLVWDENLGGIRPTSVMAAPCTPHTPQEPHQNLCGWSVSSGSRTTRAEGWRQACPSWFWFSFHSLSCFPLGTVGFVSYDSSRKVLRDGSVRHPRLQWPLLSLLLFVIIQCQEYTAVTGLG